MIKLRFELYPEDGQIKPYEHPFGYIFRGVIMEWLKNIKPELIHIFHEFEKVRPYSINCIIYNKIPKIDFILVSYMEELNNTLLQDIISTEKAKLRIGQKDYYIAQIQLEKINFEQLLNISKPVKNFNINFPTSVYFNTSMGDYPVRFPLPNLLFGNLANIWNDIYKNTLEIDRDNFLSWINAHVYTSAYLMKTVRKEIGKPRPVIGGLGNVSYNITKINENYYKHYLECINREFDHEYVNQDYLGNCKWIDILCKLGQYTNVGGNRTAGIGVMKYYPKKYLSENDLLRRIE
ncbi:MAG: CRISPR system precrRNA processing endoribonuclease RAMP protein Cas6 [Candidatus Lokiarchaeota archaeon]|nr:CRISPR system precrRNA processing endoribonuclease RAMP protein Cas6 [Candidatus Lokiarchaeota archaeon]